MNVQYLYSILIMMVLSIFSCKKSDTTPVSPASGTPEVKTKNATNITRESAEISGEVINAGGAELTERGVCWGISPNPTIETNKVAEGSGLGSYSVALSGLNAGTSYYVRSYAINSTGNTGYGSTLTFTTLSGFEEGTVEDADGNSYKTLKIGAQTWMVENLRTTKYNNGDNILTTNPANVNLNTLSPENKFQWVYNGEETNSASYGRLYSHYVTDDSRGICPAGWHIPSIEEWEELSKYLTDNGFGKNGSGSMFGKAVASTSGWNKNVVPESIGYDQSTNNSSGFNAFPNGSRGTSAFVDKGTNAIWWTSNTNGEYAYAIRLTGLLSNGFVVGDIAESKGFGRAIRCVKD